MYNKSNDEYIINLGDRLPNDILSINNIRYMKLIPRHMYGVMDIEKMQAELDKLEIDYSEDNYIIQYFACYVYENFDYGKYTFYASVDVFDEDTYSMLRVLRKAYECDNIVLKAATRFGRILFKDVKRSDTWQIQRKLRYVSNKFDFDIRDSGPVHKNDTPFDIDKYINREIK